MLSFLGAFMNNQASPNQHEDFFLGEELALQQLSNLDQMIAKKKKKFIGYPCNAALKMQVFFQWWAESSLSKAPLNDVGDPQSHSSFSLNVHPYEITVLQYFADLYSIHPHWGYITSGGTQGNEQGLYMGRRLLENHGNPIFYFSEEAHYSIASLGNELGLDTRAIRANANGEMDYFDLKEKLDPFRPALFSLSIGTTFKGAVDCIETVQSIVKEKGIQHVYYHADAALFGGYLPYYESPIKPDLNFEKHPYDSIAVSGHKFFGSPIPMGIFLIRQKHLQNIKADYIEYIHSNNMMIPCSRSSLNTLILWWIISTKHRDEFIKESNEMLANTHYFYEELKKRNYPVWLNPNSNTLFFQAPSAELSENWTLALQNCPKLGHLAHAIIMQHVDKKLINEFLQDLDKELQLFRHSDRTTV